MMKCVGLLLCAVVVSVLLAASSAQFEDCATNIKTLETALYETRDNVFQFNLGFYPPSALTSRFIRVKYSFLNEQNEDDGSCSVSFVWAIGGFLFFQPPRVFTLNSLFFSFPSNYLERIDLRLPYQCRALVVKNGTDSECSCSNDEETSRLDVLTQQLDVYAKYESQGITRENTFARAVCTEDIGGLFYSDHIRFNFVVICMAILLPLFVLFLFVVSIRNMSPGSIQSFMHPSNHGSLVALIFTGGVISIGVVVCDILACQVVATAVHEYADDIEGYPINLYIVFVTLVLDLIFFLPFLLSMLYITIFFNGREFFKRLCCDVTCINIHPVVSAVISAIVGHTVFEKVTRSSSNRVLSLMFPLMLFSPLMCISSHMGYIIIAFLTEPYKAGSMFLLYYFILLYLMFSFRRCYNNNSKMKIKFNWKGRAVSGGDNSGGQVNIELAETHREDETKMSDEAAPVQQDSTVEPKTVCCCSYSESEKGNVNTQTFCLLIFAGIFIVAIAVMFILMFLLLPIVSSNLAGYFFQLLQLIVVLVSTQIAYQLFFSSTFSISGVLEKFKEAYAKKGSNEKLSSITQQTDETLQDVVGEFAAEFTDVLIGNLHTQE